LIGSVFDNTACSFNFVSSVFWRMIPKENARFES